MYVKYIGWAIKSPNFYKWLHGHLDKPLIGQVGFVEPVVLNYIKTHKLVNSFVFDTDIYDDKYLYDQVEMCYFRSIIHKTVLSVNNGFVRHKCNYKRRDDNGWWYRCPEE